MSTDARTLPATSYPDVPLVQAPKLEAGDRLSREEFERRYRAMPEVKKAELIEGVVYMSSPVSSSLHGEPHLFLSTWLGTYLVNTPGTSGADNATVRLDRKNEPQPDLYLRILPECGGQTRDDGLYIAGGPELACEIATSSASYDLHDKKEAYRRNGVREYLVWRIYDQAIDWFRLDGDKYLPLHPRGRRLGQPGIPGPVARRSSPAGRRHAAGAEGRQRGRRQRGACGICSAA